MIVQVWKKDIPSVDASKNLHLNSLLVKLVRTVKDFQFFVIEGIPVQVDHIETLVQCAASGLSIFCLQSSGDHLKAILASLPSCHLNEEDSK